MFGGRQTRTVERLDDLLIPCIRYSSVATESQKGGQYLKTCKSVFGLDFRFKFKADGNRDRGDTGRNLRGTGFFIQRANWVEGPFSSAIEKLLMEDSRRGLKNDQS